MTLGYFAVSGLDLLNATDKIPVDEKAELIEWVYEQQVSTGGFRGSPSTSAASSSSSAIGGANVAMTYASLLILAVLLDDFKRLDRRALLRFIGALQDKDGEGGFAAEEEVGEGEMAVDRDPRFTYCAVAICSMLGEWGIIDVAKARGYLEGCQRYDGGFGASSTHESHSGMTYCCIAALHLLPPDAFEWQREEEALCWLAHRQVALSSVPLEQTQSNDADDSDTDSNLELELSGGFQGRPNKLPPDVCYSFWNGAALSLLSEHQLVDSIADASYVLSAQSRVGGIAKIPGEHPDLLHTYLGLASLSLHQEAGSDDAANEGQEGMDFGLKRLDAAWNCSLEARDWLKQHLTRQS